MIVLKTIINVLPEKQKEMLLTLLSLIDSPEKEKGCLKYGIFGDIKDKNRFRLISEWKTRQHLDHHLKSDRFIVLLGTKSLLSEPMKITIYSVSDCEGFESVNSVKKIESDLSIVMRKGVC